MTKNRSNRSTSLFSSTTEFFCYNKKSANNLLTLIHTVRMIFSRRKKSFNMFLQWKRGWEQLWIIKFPHSISIKRCKQEYGTINVPIKFNRNIHSGECNIIWNSWTQAKISEYMDPIRMVQIGFLSFSLIEFSCVYLSTIPLMVQVYCGYEE